MRWFWVLLTALSANDAGDGAAAFGVVEAETLHNMLQ
jgi:hypothetical protein